MRAYSASNQESLRARELLKDWAGEGFLTAEQYQLTETETLCDLRRTNIFLRIVLFFFALIIVGAGVALFYVVFVPHASEQTTGILLLIFSAIAYAAAELAVSQARLYRFGIEEALAACAVGSLCAGILLSRLLNSEHDREAVALVAGALASLWIWYRFGLPYAFLAAMIFVIWLPDYWTTSHAAQHAIVAALYGAGLGIVAAIRPRYRDTYLNSDYSIAEALLWLGIYLAINLQFLSLNLLPRWWGVYAASPEFSNSFYWTTFALIWCLPPAMLARGVLLKDRFVIGAGVLAAVLTLVTNKSYLSWQRHTWDPMLLGALLIGVALLIRRWLTSAPGETRHGFTARRLSGKDKPWMNAGVTAIGLVSPDVIPRPQPSSPDVHFGGGDSGGGGASSDY